MPIDRIVTDFAIRAESRLRVRGTVGAVVVGFMTSETRRFGTCENSSGVALRAIRVYVRTG